MHILKKANRLSTSKYLLIIVFVGFFVFVNMLGNSFIWDDEEMVAKNLPLFQLRNLPLLFRQGTFFSGGSSLSGWFYRPLVMTSFLLTKVVFGKSPVGFHLVQLTLHLLTACFVFVILKSLFEKINKDLAKPISFLATLIFVVHPAHVEAISYIASVAEPLYSLFLLALFLLIIKRKLSGYKRYFWGGVLFLLALLTKEGAMVFFPIVIVYLYLFDKKALKNWVVSLSLSVFVYLAVRLSFFGIQTQRADFLSPISEASFGQRLLTAPLVFTSFLKTFFFPRVLSISQHMVVKNMQGANFWLPFVITFLFLAFIFFFLIKKKDKLAIFFAGWFLISLLPVLNIIMPLDMSFAERWLYFPMIGLLGLLCSLLLTLKIPSKNFIFIFIIGFLAVSLLSIRTIARNRNWKDGYSLYSHDIKLQPESFDLQNNLGVELSRKGDEKDALVRFEKSVRLQPRWAISLNNLGVAHERSGDYEKAYEYYKKAVEKENYYLAYENFANLIFKKEGPEETLNFLKAALPKFPNNEKLIVLASISYYQLGQKTEALMYAQKAYSLNPTNSNLYLYQTIQNDDELNL